MCGRTNDDNQPRRLVGWLLGHRDADITTLKHYGGVRYIGSWKYTVMRTRRMQNTEPKVQGCLACANGVNIDLGWKHTVRFDSGGNSVKRADVDGPKDTSDTKRTRLTKNAKFQTALLPMMMTHRD